MNNIVEKILNARVYDVAHITSIDRARSLSARFGNSILLKREDAQPVFSFKCRGAYNKIYHLSQEDQKKGVVAASAGNHAQGVALAAELLNIQATIVMPKTTPRIKVQAVESRGAITLLHGDTFEEAVNFAKALVEDKGLVYIPPYDDIEIIAGQGTVGVEIVDQLKSAPYAVFVPVGGGGLLSGVASFLRHTWPEIKIFGVEPEDAACLDLAMKMGKPSPLKEVGLFAEGCAVAQIGDLTYQLIRASIDGVIKVTNDEICAAIKDIFEDTRSIAEPAGALALAGLKKYTLSNGIRDKELLTIISGANTNFDRLRYISERTEIGEKREAILCAYIPERPGEFKTFCEAIGRRNITEFNYRFSGFDQALVFVGISVEPGGSDLRSLMDNLLIKGYEVDDLTNNEIAKLHIRHMIGGTITYNLKKEVCYRFEFPERPGALANFLDVLGSKWNISLFHYRNHGADYGRVLVGFQINSDDEKKLHKAFDVLGYPYWNETENKAYTQFLGRATPNFQVDL